MLGSDMILSDIMIWHVCRGMRQCRMARCGAREHGPNSPYECCIVLCGWNIPALTTLLPVFVCLCVKYMVRR